MLTDLENYFDNNIEHVASEASDQYINLGAARNIGAGRNLYVVAIVNVALAGGTSMTLKLQSDDNTSFSSATDLQTVKAFLTSGSAAGETAIVRLAPITTPERYIRGYWTESGAVTAGTFTVFICDDVDMQRMYPNGYTIS